MAFRDYVLNNLKWKISALFLAIFVWCIIQFALWNGWTSMQPVEHPFLDLQSQWFTNRPVAVLTRPEDPRTFKLDPPFVDLEVSGRKRAMNRLNPGDIQVFIDLTDMPDIAGGVREVLASGPADLEIHAQPKNVIVQRTSSPEHSLTNSLTNIVTSTP